LKSLNVRIRGTEITVTKHGGSGAAPFNERAEEGVCIVSIENETNTGHLKERLLESIDALAERAKDIVKITSPIIEEVLVLIRSAEQAFGQGAGPSRTGTATPTERPRSDELWAGKSAWTTLLVIGAAGGILAYLMWPRR
jgi:hypothetical protein